MNTIYEYFQKNEEAFQRLKINSFIADGFEEVKYKYGAVLESIIFDPCKDKKIKINNIESMTNSSVIEDLIKEIVSVSDKVEKIYKQSLPFAFVKIEFVNDFVEKWLEEKNRYLQMYPLKR